MRSILLLCLIFGTTKSFAWGGRGHAAICEAAVFLVKEKGLSEYLKNKPQMMAHLCNIPDTYWRSLPSEQTRVGNPTHFIDVDLIDLKIKDVPFDLKSLDQKYTGTPNKFKNNIPIRDFRSEYGGAWWRADQFMSRIAALKPILSNAGEPKNPADEQSDEFPFNKAIYQMVVDMGIMGHYVGDISQPLHNTGNYDGYTNGHGGIHAYYEDASVAEFDGDLVGLIVQESRKQKNKKYLIPATTFEKMKIMSEISFAELDQLFKLDPVTKPSEVKKEKGMELKTAAERLDSSVGHKKFKKMILGQFVRSASLLAALWDEAYVSAGRPPMKAFKSYKFPFTPEFIAPN